MATVISNEEASRCSFKNYPKKCVLLAKLDQQREACVYVIGEVVRVFSANFAMEEGKEEEHSSKFVELRDKSGSGFVKLDSERDTDSAQDKETKQ
jgi:hypothetical protein